ncbi:MAG: FG-GAP repeat domain-containing protein, partial [Persicimonas sp.]
MCAQKWRRLVFVAVGCVLMALAGCGSCDDSVGGGGGLGVDGGDAGGDSSAPDVGPDVATDADAVADADAEQPCPQASQCADECCEDGQECVADQCMDPCDGTRCGGSMQLCCADQEVCIFDGCHVPGDDCDNSFECSEDDYCESTLSKCLPRDAVTEECTFRPPIGEFTPSSERSFGGVEHDGQMYDKSFTTPAVADVDADGIPEIVALLYRGSLDEALLAVIDSQTMDLIAYGGVGRVQNNSAGIAVADLDPSTPELEIVAQQDGGGLVAFRLDAADGELSEWWSNDEGPLGQISQESAPAIADLDGDGSAEVVLGLSVVDANGDIWGGINEGAAGGHDGSRVISVVADLDGEVDDDGNRDLELVAGNRALASDGSVLWDVSDTVDDGYPAVGDFDGDSVPEVVTVSSGEVYVLNGEDGSVIFGPRAIPGGGEGGPPTIADFDGDGRLEFSAAGQGRYTVYDMDCQGDDPDPTLCASLRDDGIL